MKMATFPIGKPLADIKTIKKGKEMKVKAFVPGILFIYFFVLNNAFSQDEFLLVVDVQKKFYENTEIEKRANEMVQNINKIIKNFEAQKVIYVKATGKMLSVSLKGFKVVPISPVPELDSNLIVFNSNIFTKVEGNAFALEELNNFLITNGAKTVIIVGLLVEKCIYSTAIGGKEKGYDIYVVPEAIISRSKTKKEKAFEKMTKKGIKILSIGEIINAP